MLSTPLRSSALHFALTVTVLVTALALPATAEAQLRANRLFDEECLAEDFTAFDDVIMTALATHQSGFGDVYQAICDDEDCWGFSINRFAAVNVLTTGLTAGEYTWFVCAWNGMVRRVVANLSGGAAIFTPEPAAPGQGDSRILDLDDPRVPDDLRRFVAKLQRVPTGRH